MEVGYMNVRNIPILLCMVFLSMVFVNANAMDAEDVDLLAGSKLQREHGQSQRYPEAREAEHSRQHGLQAAPRALQQIAVFYKGLEFKYPEECFVQRKIN